jgi:hypothetical protein
MRFASALNFFRRVPATVGHDPADMGTCFGMEASLEDSDFSLASDAELSADRERAALESPLAWLSRRSS